MVLKMLYRVKTMTQIVVVEDSDGLHEVEVWRVKDIEGEK